MIEQVFTEQSGDFSFRIWENRTHNPSCFEIAVIRFGTNGNEYQGFTVGTLDEAKNKVKEFRNDMR